jgi:PBP1b-binding outer membrane lipoprotein LpoB
MKVFAKSSFVVFVLASILSGCSSIGNAPAGQSPDEAKAAFDGMSPDEKIKMIESSPMPPAEKEARIKELEAQGGKRSSNTGAPQIPNGQ